MYSLYKKIDKLLTVKKKIQKEKLSTISGFIAKSDAIQAPD